jgi:GntR family transcriptional regulator
VARQRVSFASPFPKYFQIQSILRERILRACSAGSRLPAEMALCREFGVSRITLRQALAALERERLIRREKGRGTFVAARLPRPVPKQKFTGIAEDLFDASVATRVKLLDQAVVSASAEVADWLRVPAQENVLHVERVWYVDQRPFSYAHCYLPLDMAQKLTGDDLESAPISILLHRRHRVPIIEAEQVIEPCLADPHTAAVLDLPVGTLLLHIERIYISRNKRPVCYVHSFYRSDRYQYSVKLNQSFRQGRASLRRASGGG